jgi:branched-chain amino acid transport system ATP-binding protein
MSHRSDSVPALQLAAVSKAFGGVQAVNHVDLTIRTGERRALIGPNGAGKTTLFNLVAGELPVDCGTIHMFGQDVTRQTIQQRAKLGLGRTYQISQLFWALSVIENLFLAGFRARAKRINLLRRWDQHTHERDWAYQIAEQVSLTDKLEVPIAELSHGEQRQLEIGMALAARPRLIMLDEPAAGLSPAERVSVANLIRGLDHDMTIILIEHDMEVLMSLAETVTVLHQGRVIASGQPDEIRANEHVQAVYLGVANV